MNKKLFVVPIGLLASLSLLQTNQVRAETPTPITGKTAIDIQLKAQTTPIDPGDPSQTTVALKRVPEFFKFTDDVSATGDYKIKGSIIDSKNIKDIAVYNASEKQSWQVVADLSSLEMTNESQTTIEIPDPSLTLATEQGEYILSGTGESGVVFKSIQESNTGVYPTGLQTNPIKEITIAFKDSEGAIEAGSYLTATISYALTNLMEIQ